MINLELLNLIEPVLISLGSPDELAMCPTDVLLKLAAHPDDIFGVTLLNSLYEIPITQGSSYKVYDSNQQFLYEVFPSNTFFGEDIKDLEFLVNASKYTYFYLTFDDRVLMGLYV